MKIKKRNDTLDVISGILIIWMIAYHSFQWGNLTESISFQVLIRCFYFFMPWFYFKSGIVFSDKYSLKNVVEKGVNEILFPMFIWTLIGYLLTMPAAFVKGESVWKVLSDPLLFLFWYGDTIGNSPLWFLLSLFFVRIGLRLIINLSSLYLFSLTFCFACIGWVLYFFKLEILPLGFTTFPLGIFFASLGIIFNRFQVVDTARKIEIWVILISVLASFLFASYVDVHRNALWYGSYWFFILSSILAIVASLLLFEGSKCKVLAVIGKKSMIYLILHWPVFYVVKQFCYFLGVSQNNYYYIIILFTTSVGFSILVSKYVPMKYLGLDGFQMLKALKHFLINK